MNGYQLALLTRYGQVFLPVSIEVAADDRDRLESCWNSKRRKSESVLKASGAIAFKKRNVVAAEIGHGEIQIGIAIEVVDGHGNGTRSYRTGQGRGHGIGVCRGEAPGAIAQKNGNGARISVIVLTIDYGEVEMCAAGKKSCCREDRALSYIAVEARSDAVAVMLGKGAVSIAKKNRNTAGDSGIGSGNAEKDHGQDRN